MEPEFNLPSSDDVEALLESIPDDKRRAMKEMMQVMVANQETTDKRIMD